jgi:hypothetical protein
MSKVDAGQGAVAGRSNDQDETQHARQQDVLSHDSVNEVDRAAVLLQLAGDLAKAQDAHLIGLFVIPGLRIYPANGMGMTPELFEVHREMFTDRAEAAKALFEARVRDVDLPAEWRLVEAGSPLVAGRRSPAR